MSSDIDVLKLELRPFIKRGFATGPGNVGGTTLVDATLVEAATFWNDSWVLLRTGDYAGELRRVTASVPGTLTLDHTVGGMIAAGTQYVMLAALPVTVVAGGGLKADLQQVLGQGADIAPGNELLTDPSKALREELRRQGVVWYLYADIFARQLTPPQRGRAPWIGGGTFMNAGQRLRNGNTMICDYAAHCVYEVTKDWSVVWQFGEYGVAGADLTHLNLPHFVYFDEDAGTVLITDTANNRVLEVNYTTRAVLHNLGATTSGIINRPHCAVYMPDGEILITVFSSHFVVKTDWAGVESWSWGLYGTSGQTEVPPRLDHPTAAFPFPSGFSQYVIISDYSNDRVLAVNEDGTVAWRMVACRPECAELGLDLRIGIGSEDGCFAVDRLGALLFYIPYSGPYFEPTIDGTYLHSQVSNMVLEFDPHYLKSYALPCSRTLLSAYDLVATESVGPIYGDVDHVESMQVVNTFPYDKVTYYIRSTQTATFEPLIARTGGGSVMTATGLRFTDWIPIDNEALVANVWSIYTVVPHAPFMAPRITMGGINGKVDVFVSRLPKGVS